MEQLPRLDDLPIPQDVQPGPGWTAQMVEMAAHIGAYHTMLIVDHFGGQIAYIPMNAERNPFRDLIGPARAAIVSRIYGPHRFQVPTAKSALSRARRAGVLGMVRRREMTARDAARILGTSRTYLTHLLNHSREDGPAPEMLRRRVSKHDPRQIDIFAVIGDVTHGE